MYEQALRLSYSATKPVFLSLAYESPDQMRLRLRAVDARRDLGCTVLLQRTLSSLGPTLTAIRSDLAQRSTTTLSREL